MRFGLGNASVTPRTLMAVDELLPNPGQATDHQTYLYQQKVGSITYSAAITRLDIARATQKLAEFLTNPSPAHMAAADRVLLYLSSTRTLAIEYNGNVQAARLFFSASDSSFADDSNTRKSTGGLCHNLFGGATDWKCFKHKTVSTSTTEAELISLAVLVKMLLWWNRFFHSIDLQFDNGITADCDNQCSQ
jgi:hypothetical protein